jgi:hypothetical protein
MFFGTSDQGTCLLQERVCYSFLRFCQYQSLTVCLHLSGMWCYIIGHWCLRFQGSMVVSSAKVKMDIMNYFKLHIKLYSSRLSLSLHPSGASRHLIVVWHAEHDIDKGERLGHPSWGLWYRLLYPFMVGISTCHNLHWLQLLEVRRIGWYEMSLN